MNEIARQVINIEPDFAAIWGDLNEDAYEGLKAEIKADGIRDPLVIWNPNNDYILVDGHNRLRIAKELHINAVPVAYKTFNDKAEAAEWIVNHQSSRRNITDWQKYNAVAAFQKILREQAKEQQVRKPQSVLENSPKQNPINVRKQTAEAGNLTEWKVRQGDYIRKNATEEQKADLDSGKKTMKEVFKETVNANTPKKADRIKKAEEVYEATKPEEGKVADFQKAKVHKAAERQLYEEQAHETYEAIYKIVSSSAKLTKENMTAFYEIYSEKDRAKVLMYAKTVWDAGQKLTEIARWIQEVKK